MKRFWKCFKIQNNIYCLFNMNKVLSLYGYIQWWNTSDDIGPPSSGNRQCSYYQYHLNQYKFPSFTKIKYEWIETNSSFDNCFKHPVLGQVRIFFWNTMIMLLSDDRQSKISIEQMFSYIRREKTLVENDPDNCDKCHTSWDLGNCCHSEQWRLCKEYDT